MSTPEERASENLTSYYQMVMSYLHAKYDRHSIQPVHMDEYKIAELNYYEAQARQIAEQMKAGDDPTKTIIVGHV